MHKDNIVLAGFMGSGKTTVGRILAEKLDCRFVDLDREIEDTLGMSVSDIFRNFGEKRFRQEEILALKRILSGSGTVLSLGGGAVLAAENRRMLADRGVVFMLEASVETLVSRTAAGSRRPLLRNTGNPEEYISEMLAGRQRYYDEAADYVIDAEKNPAEAADEIKKIYSGIEAGGKHGA